MKKYNCLILEDTLGDQLALEMILDEFPEIEATYVHSPQGFLQELFKKSYQIFIVDIMLNDSLTGIDLIHSITDISAWVIISSSVDSKDYYEQYKDLRFNKFFIKKPIDEFIFKTNLESFLFNHQSRESEGVMENNKKFITLKQGNYIYKINYAEISIIETDNHATTVYTHNNKYTTYTSLKSLEVLLAEMDFGKPNRNTLVNLNVVKRINVKENYVEIGSRQVSLSRRHKQVFMANFENTIEKL